jgi:hypothetical protein
LLSTGGDSKFVFAIAVGDLLLLMNRSSPGSDALHAICNHRLKKQTEIQ